MLVRSIGLGLSFTNVIPDHRIVPESHRRIALNSPMSQTKGFTIEIHGEHEVSRFIPKSNLKVHVLKTIMTISFIDGLFNDL